MKHNRYINKITSIENLSEMADKNSRYVALAFIAAEHLGWSYDYSNAHIGICTDYLYEVAETKGIKQVVRIINACRRAEYETYVANMEDAMASFAY